MSKRQTVDMTGYIVSVSPLKKNKSFHVQIQTDEASKPRKAICFDDSKFDEMAKKNISGDPVKVKKIILQDLTDKSKNLAPYIINKEIEISEVDPANVTFERREEEVRFLTYRKRID